MGQVILQKMKKKNLEAKLKQETLIDPGNIREVISAKDYTNLFSKRYREEKPFRDIVHKYMKLNKVDLLKLNFYKTFFPGFYNEHVDNILSGYAIEVKKGLVDALEIKKELEKIGKTTHNIQSGASELIKRLRDVSLNQEQYKQTLEIEQDKKRDIQSYLDERLREEENYLSLQEQDI